MLLTITYKGHPATDLGYLLHKNPARVQRFSLSFGEAHVFYPVADEDQCTVALLLEMDTIRLVRAQMKGKSDVLSLKHYVNDRPYVASSFLSVAIAQVFGTALSGRSKERPELAAQKLPLEATLDVVSCRGGEAFLRKCFEPLGYELEMERLPLDERFPEWGMSHYYSLTLRGSFRLQELLSHLYVLMPVLDREKHYWIGKGEQQKLLKHAETWLANHPEKQMIVTRYLNYRRELTQSALAQLTTKVKETEAEETDQQKGQLEKPIRLHEERMQRVTEVLVKAGAQRVLDLGCAEGKLIRYLLQKTQIPQITGVDLSLRALEMAKRRIKDTEGRVTLLQSSLLYRDDRLKGFDAAAVVEVIEHLPLDQLSRFEEVLFQYTRPKLVVLTTPNIEYNVKFDGLPVGKLRHRDHRFEWTRKQFQDWAQRVGKVYRYTVSFQDIGSFDAEVGAPTQMAVFRMEDVAFNG